MNLLYDRAGSSIQIQMFSIDMLRCSYHISIGKVNLGNNNMVWFSLR